MEERGPWEAEARRLGAEVLGATGSSSGCARRDMFAGAVNMRYSFGCIATESGVLCMLRVVLSCGQAGAVGRDVPVATEQAWT